MLFLFLMAPLSELEGDTNWRRHL